MKNIYFFAIFFFAFIALSATPASAEDDFSLRIEGFGHEMKEGWSIDTKKRNLRSIQDTEGRVLYTITFIDNTKKYSLEKIKKMEKKKLPSSAKITPITLMNKKAFKIVVPSDTAKAFVLWRGFIIQTVGSALTQDDERAFDWFISTLSDGLQSYQAAYQFFIEYIDEKEQNETFSYMHIKKTPRLAHYSAKKFFKNIQRLGKISYDPILCGTILPFKENIEPTNDLRIITPTKEISLIYFFPEENAHRVIMVRENDRWKVERIICSSIKKE